MLRKFVIALLLLTLLSSCQPSGLAQPIGNTTDTTELVSTIRPTASETTEATPTTRVTPTDRPPTKTYTPTASLTPLAKTSTPTQSACMQAGGQVEVHELTTVLLPDPLVYRIYLPPCYNENTEVSYPVLYLIHGQSFSDTQWDRLGVPEVADRLIASGEMNPFIVVMPRDRVWTEPSVDNFGLAVEQSLVPWIDEQYRTIPDRAHRAIGGLSRGAAWAVHIGLSNWDKFGTVGVHSGFVFHTDVQPIYEWLNSIPEGTAPRVYLDIGNSDRADITNGAVWLEDLLTRYNIPHEWHLFVGEHEEDYWKSHVEDYLRWYTLDWNQ